MNKKKILYYVHGSYVQGGAFLSLYELLKKLKKDNDTEVLVAIVEDAIDEVKEVIDELELENVIVSKWNYTFVGRFLIGYLSLSLSHIVLILKDIFLSTANLKNFNKVVNEFNPDIIHFNSVTLLSLAYLSGFKGINIVHCREGWRSFPFKWFRHRIIQLFQSNITHFICISEIEKTQIDPLLTTNKKSTVIGNPIEKGIKNMPSKFNTPITLPSAITPTIAYFGGFQTNKGCIEFLTAIKDLKRPLTVYFCGPTGSTKRDITKAKNIIKIIQKNSIHTFHNLGLVKNSMSVMSFSDLILVPHTKPHFSRVIIEAWSLRKPVVAFSDDFTRELQTKSGGGLHLVSVQSANALCSKIEELLFNKKITRSSAQKGYKYWVQNHKPDKVYKKIIGLYRNLTCKRGDLLERE